MSETKKLPVTSYRGTRDFYPEDMHMRNYIFGTMRRVAESFGYQEYDGPMLESFELYAAKSGDELVNEQLYHFIDRGNRHVAIRPEMTPTVARMVAARLSDLQRPIRWFSFPNLWRYEKPQRGRLREHWQFNVDILGSDAIDADREIIEIACRVMFSLGADKNDFSIHISNRKILTYFLETVLKLPESLWPHIHRAIDKRSKISTEAFDEMLSEMKLSSDQIGEIHAYLNLTDREIDRHPVSQSPAFADIQHLLEGLSILGLDDVCRLDFSIVRGLEYYTGTVFEMYDMAPENRRALFGGGRYDNLVGLFSKERVSGVGFGMGDVTIGDFLQTHNLLPVPEPPAHVHVALFDENTRNSASSLADLLRSEGLKTTCQLEPSKLGKQFKWADIQKIPIVVLQGPEELSRNHVQVKHLATHNQITVPLPDLVQTIKKLLDIDV
ncbi:MAG: histidine--tRNA ligase [bacterium]